MTIYEAISVRTSARTYLSTPLTPEQRRELSKTLEQCSRRGGVRFRLVCGRPGPFLPLRKSYGMLKGVQNFFVFAGPEDDPDLEEKCGYYGEQAVLAAAAMGLGTCWVGGTFDRESCRDLVGPGEKLVCVAAVGPVPGRLSGREKLLTKAARSKRRTAEDLSEAAAEAPAWFAPAMEAVRLAPSAMNRQGYRFVCNANGTVSARLTATGAFSMTDLGIAKLHFELGAHGGEWSWGNGGTFRETESDTAKREIREETGLEVELDTGFRQVVTYSPKRGVIKDVVFFVATPVGGKEKPQEAEVTSIAWFSFRTAREMATYASDEEILLAAEKYLNEKEGGKEPT